MVLHGAGAGGGAALDVGLACALVAGEFGEFSGEGLAAALEAVLIGGVATHDGLCGGSDGVERCSNAGLEFGGKRAGVGVEGGAEFTGVFVQGVELVDEVLACGEVSEQGLWIFGVDEIALACADAFEFAQQFELAHGAGEI